MTDFDIFLELSHISALIAGCVSAWVAFTFFGLIVRRNKKVGYLARGIFLIHMAVLLRASYWDVFRVVMPEDAWEIWYELSNGTAVNLVFNALVILAGYSSLRAVRATERTHVTA